MSDMKWTTAVGDVGHGYIRVRGYAIEDIIRGMSFSEAIYLTIRGERPTPSQRTVLEAALCSILEHGVYAPTTLAARVVASSTPQSIVPGMAAGMLTVGSVTVSPQDSAAIIQRVKERMDAGKTMQSAADAIADEMIASRERFPGLGHPLHPEGDPRAIVLGEVAWNAGHRTEITESYFAARASYLKKTGRNLPVNIDGMLGCVLAEIGFEPIEMPGVAGMSFMPGVIAHCAEEIRGRNLLRVDNATYVGPEPRELAGS